MRTTVRRAGALRWVWLVLGICTFGFFLRVLNAQGDLGTPHVDENAVVDQAVAFMGGEWRYYLLEYGPLPMYLLAGVYHLVAWLRGMTPLEYGSQVFFDHEQQYYIARLFCAVCYAVLAVAVYRVLAPRFGRWAAGISSMLLALPVLDELNQSKARVDIPQGAFQIGAVLSLVVAMESGKLRHWVIAGLCAGCAIACKPMPGLLVVPCFLAASWFAAGAAAEGGSRASPRAANALRSFGRRLLDTVRRPGLWCGILVTLLAAAACNPTSLDIEHFISEQVRLLAYYSGPEAPGGHQNVFQVFLPLGAVFLWAAALCVCATPLLRDARASLIALFPLVYITAFWGRPMRPYYVIAPAMGLCLVIGIGVGELLKRASGLRAMFSTAIEPLLAAAFSLGVVAAVDWAPVSHLERTRDALSSSTLAREWIYAHVPSGTGIFHSGAFGDGPRLVSTNPKEQKRYSDFFEYGRSNYKFFKDAYWLAYERYEAAHRPMYRIESTRRRAEPLESGKSNALLVRELAEHARAQGEEYIVLGEFGGSKDVMDLHYPWFKSVELVQQFRRIAIFRVLPEAAEQTKPVADAGRPL